ncbi:FMN-dependent NADH-azoreductase [Paraburkholderia sp. WC7.3g]
MKIMHVDASAKRERSNSRALARYFLERLREERVDFELDYLDVTLDTPAHVTKPLAIATFRVQISHAGPRNACAWRVGRAVGKRRTRGEPRSRGAVSG